MQRPAAGADKQRPVGGARVGTGREIVGDGLAHRRQDRQLARFAALAGDGQRFAGRRLGAAQPQRLRQAQTAAMDQRQERRIALALPPRPRQLAGGVDRGDGVVDGQRLGYRGGQFRRAQRRKRGCRSEAATLQKPHEIAQHGEVSRERTALDAVCGPAREKGAEIGGRNPSSAARLGIAPKCSVRKSRMETRSRPRRRAYAPRSGVRPTARRSTRRSPRANRRRPKSAPGHRLGQRREARPLRLGCGPILGRRDTGRRLQLTGRVRATARS